ncbi:MAG: hypothetical protein R3E18_04900 [Sphingomonadaceae bacterium]
MAAKAETRLPPAPLLAAIGSVAAGLAMLSALLAAGAVLRQSAPAQAASLWPGDALALERISGGTLGDDALQPGAAMRPQDAAGMEATSLAVLRAEPTAAQALRNIALARQAAAPDEAASLMRLSLSLSRRDPAVRLWLMQEGVMARDYPAAFAHFDAIMKLEPQLRPALMQQFVQLLALDEARPNIAALLDQEPDWAEQFWQEAAKFPPGFDNLVALRLARGQAQDATQRRNDEFILQALVNQGRYAQAEKLAQRVVPGFGGSGLRNGQFAQEPEGRPFDWRLFPGADHAVLLDRSVLSLSAAPQAEGIAASQLVVLAPGSYRLSYTLVAGIEAQGDGVQLAANCMRGGQRGALAALPVTSNRQAGILRVSEACRYVALDIVLARSTSNERREIALDAITLERIAP